MHQTTGNEGMYHLYLFSHLQECWVNATALKVEWCCSSCACAMWYTQEVELQLEEMCWVLAFLKWDRDQWNKCAFHVPKVLMALPTFQQPCHLMGKQWRLWKVWSHMHYARLLYARKYIHAAVAWHFCIHCNSWPWASRWEGSGR